MAARVLASVLIVLVAVAVLVGAYAVYWEGFTQTLTGPAEWTGEGVELVGPPSFSFSNEDG